ncbi:TolC family protein [Roseateles sp. So40a]|uniref:TolC family protein n=1 Tax=Roseateles sp. So40a TaxID=3400226 RepID=UPI003A8C0FA2
MDARFNPKQTFAATVISLTSLLWALPASAADIPGCDKQYQTDTPLTLADAVDIALCRNAKTTQAWLAIQAQTAEVGVARAASFPTVTASLSAQDNRTQTGGLTATSRTAGLGSSLGLNWRLFDFGERAANRTAAALMLDAAVASRDDTIRKTVADTIQAYFAAQQARATLEARQQAARQGARTLAAAERREERGAAGRADTLQAETALARARLSRQRAQSDVDRSFATLAYTIGAPADARITFPARMQTPDPTPLPDLQDLMDDASAHHPAILAARAQRDADAARAAAARAQGRPTVDFSLTHQLNAPTTQLGASSRQRALGVGFTVNIPIFDGGANKYQSQRARVQADRSTEQALDIEQQVLSELVKCHAEVASSRAGLDAAQQWLDTANIALESAENRYARGVGDIMELINAQNAVAEALESQAQGEAQWNAARLKLLADIGQWSR